MKRNQSLAVALILYEIVTSCIMNRIMAMQTIDQFAVVLELAQYGTPERFDRQMVTIPRLAQEKNRDRWITILRQIYIHFYPNGKVSETILECLFQLVIMPFITLIKGCQIPYLSTLDQCLHDLHNVDSKPNVQLTESIRQCLADDLGSLDPEVISSLSIDLLTLLEQVVQQPMKWTDDVLNVVQIVAPKLLEGDFVSPLTLPSVQEGGSFAHHLR